MKKEQRVKLGKNPGIKWKKGGSTRKSRSRSMSFEQTMEGSATELSSSTSFGKEGSDEAGSGIGLVRSTSLRRGTKRVSLSVDDIMEVEDLNSQEPSTPNEEQCDEKSMLESLHIDVLLKILSYVDHDDLKNLVLVSKTMRDATLTVKETHFEYTTPSKNICKFMDVDDDDMSEEARARGHFAPKPSKVPRSRLTDKMSDISVELFKD